MMIKKYCLFLLAIVHSTVSFAEVKEIALTIDDLPFVGSAHYSPGNAKRDYDRLNSILQTLISYKIPATGFIIAGSIRKGQWEVLEQFRNAGIILGNHTYSHLNLNTTNTSKYIENIVKADSMLIPLFSGPKYFRYPYLAEGHGDKKQQVYQRLTSLGYTIAPVTIDSKDFRFNDQFLKVSWSVRHQYLAQHKKRYLDYIWQQTLKAEKINRNKEVTNKQILLVHANLLNSLVLSDIIDMYQNHGYRFISLAEALNDSKSLANQNHEWYQQSAVALLLGLR